MTFQMQSWSSRDHAWTPMEDGPARSRWLPKPTAIEAARQCIEWTGLISIPAMQVMDVTTGEVVWRDSRHYPDAGPSIFPEWDHAVREEARRESRRLYEAGLCVCGAPYGSDACRRKHPDGPAMVQAHREQTAAPEEPTLFDLTGGGAA